MISNFSIYTNPKKSINSIVDLTVDRDFQQRQNELEKQSEFLLETLILRITERIAIELEKSRLTYSEFAKKLGVSQPYVSKIMNGKPNLTLKSLAEIAAVLSMRFRNDIFENIIDVQHRDVLIEWKRHFEKKGSECNDPELNLEAG